MTILAFDSSNEQLSIALLRDDGAVASYLGEGGAKASETILPMINALLNDEKLTLKDLSGIAFGAGPGAFTGVRVACGVAQGLGFGANIPVVGVNTLHAMAESFSQAHGGHAKVIVCIDARLSELYFAALEKVDGVWLEISPTALYKPDNLPTTDGENWAGVGNGWQVSGDQLQAKYANQMSNTYPSFMPEAISIARLAAPILASGDADLMLRYSASLATPLYVRNRVALTEAERALGQRL